MTNIDNLIAYWKQSLPPKVDYASLVCAPAWAYGYEYVYEDEYGYIVDATIKALEELRQLKKSSSNLVPALSKLEAETPMLSCPKEEPNVPI